MLSNTVTLKLDSSYKPIGIISWRDAITLVITGKAFVVEAYQKFIRSAKKAWQVPAVIVLKRFVRYEHIKFSCSRKNILLRDDNQCQYCGCFFEVSYLTLDHVIPRSRGGINSWRNLVAACRDCNQKKGCKLPWEANMFPLQRPVAPDKVFFVQKYSKRISEEMKRYT